MNEDGNNIRTLIQPEEGIYSIDWFSDSKRIAYTDNDKLKILNLNSMHSSTIIDNPEYIVKSISVSPLGNQISYQQDHNSGDKNIAIVNADGSDNKIIADLEVSCTNPTFLPTADYVMFECANNLFMVTPDASKRKRLTYGLDVSHEYSISPDGSQVAFIASSTDLNTLFFREDVTTNSYITQYSIDSNNGTNYIRQPCWSPDGKKIAFVMRNNSRSQIYILNLASKQIQQVSSEEYGGVYKPAWLPQSNSIIFTNGSDGMSIIKIDLENNVRTILANIQDSISCSFSVSNLSLGIF
jgi:TolB protein